MAYCTQCGAELTGPFCTQCGAAADGAVPNAPNPNSNPNPNGANANPYAVGSQSNYSGWEDNGDTPCIPGPLTAWLICMKKSFSILGRASRSEYWWFVLINNFLMFLFFHEYFFMVINGSFMTASLELSPAARLGAIYALITFPAVLCATIRRLHDTDRSGLLIFLQFLPYIGPFILFIFTILSPTPGPNRFGNPPVKKMNK